MILVKLKDVTYDLGTFKAIAADVVLKQVRAASSQIIALCHNFERHMTWRQGEQGDSKTQFTSLSFSAN